MQPEFNHRDPAITKKNIIYYMQNVLKCLDEKRIYMPEGYKLYFEHDKSISRHFQALETSLVFAGYIVAGEPFKYQQIEVFDTESWSSLFRTRKIKREETYQELIWRLAHEFIDKNIKYEYLPGLDIDYCYSKFTYNCAVTTRDGEGKSAGPCCYYLKDKITCPVHGVVRRIKED